MSKQQENCEIKELDELIEKNEQIEDVTVNEAIKALEQEHDFEEKDLNAVLHEMETARDVSVDIIRKKNKKLKKTMSQQADDVVNNFLATHSSKAWRDLQEFFWYGIRQYCFNYLKNLDAADDMTIDTFAKAWEAIDTYDVNKARFSTWLWTICRNNCLHYFYEKKKMDIVDNDITDIYESVLSKSDYTEEQTTAGFRVINGNIENLSFDQLQDLLCEKTKEEMHNLKGVGRDIIEMKVLDDMKIREIADKLHMNESTVKNHLYKCKENLSRIIRINHSELYNMYIEAAQQHR